LGGQSGRDGRVDSRLGQEFVHAIHPAAPERLVLIKQRRCRCEAATVAPNQSLAALLAFGDQLGSLQHGHMLLDGSEAHVVVRCERRHGLFTLQHPSDDVPSSAISQRGKDPVDTELTHMIYNHVVARYAWSPGNATGSGKK